MTKPARVLDLIQGTLLIGVLILTPWFFASVDWVTIRAAVAAIAVAALAGLCCGCLKFDFKSFLSWKARAGWDSAAVVLTVAICSYAALAFANAGKGGTIPFLPGAQDEERAYRAMLAYGSLAVFFWSMRQWIARGRTLRGAGGAVFERMLLVFFLVAGHVTVLTVVSLVQQMTNQPKLLWLRTPILSGAYYLFGPFDYRNAAAGFLNLAWPPIAFSAWWVWRNAKGVRRFEAVGSNTRLLDESWLGKTWLWLVVGVVPILSAAFTGSRTGLLILALAVLFSLVFMSAIDWRFVKRHRTRLGALLLGIGLLGAAVGWKPIMNRLNQTQTNYKQGLLSARRAQDQNSKVMILDHPLFGVGPGCYEQAFLTYKFPNPFGEANWETRENSAGRVMYTLAHNDWLQTIAEWGALGFSMILAALGAVFYGVWTQRLLPLDFKCGISLALVTVLTHGVVDYPLQYFCTILLATTWLAAGSAEKTRASR